MPTDLKSGMPEAVLMPAPVWNTTLEDCQTNCASSHTFCSNSSGGSKICCPVRAEGSGQNVSHSVKANSHRLICPRLAQRKQKGLEKAACPHVPPLPSTLQDSHLSQGQSYDLPSAQEALHPLPCLLSALPSFLSPCSLCSSYKGLVPFPPTGKARCCSRAFGQTVPSDQIAISPQIPT